MQKSTDDCFYYLTSSCAKGPACPYRHNPTVLTCNVMCPAWLRGNCTDSACALLHSSSVQRPAVSNGKPCFYEKKPMGCLNLDCTFVHLRPRPNQRMPTATRPSTTNLVNKDVVKPTSVPNSPSTPQITSPQINLSTPKVETPTVPETPAKAIENEIIPAPMTVPVNNEPVKTVANSAATKSSEKIPDRTKAVLAAPSRTVGNRNVVIAESTTVPNRKVVQGASNRVVVSSNSSNVPKKLTGDSDSDIDLDDLMEQENDLKRTNNILDISFPCSAPSITNRLLTSLKPSAPTNDTKPIRLNRDRLPATKISAPQLAESVSSPFNGEKTSAGTGLSQEDERRTNRLERFKKQPVSPPRSAVSSNGSIPTRSVVPSSPNERKRRAPDQAGNDSPPLKRLSSQQENNHHRSTTIGDLCSPPPSSHRSHERHHHRRRRSSSSSPENSPPPRQTYSSASPMNESAWKREVDAFLAKTSQPKMPLSTTTTGSPQPVSLLSLRPRYRPPVAQQHQPIIPRRPPPPPPPLQRPRHPSSVAIKRPVTPVTAPSPIPSKPIAQPPPISIAPVPSTKATITSKEEEENRLLDVDGPTDVVDTSFIDEALLEADDWLEFM